MQHSDFVYTRLKALVWASGGISFPDMMQRSAGELLAQLLTNSSEKRPLVVNCAGIRDIDDHAVGPIISAQRDSSRVLILVNAEQIEEPAIKYITTQPRSNYRTDSGHCIIVFGTPQIERQNANEIIDQVAEVEQKAVCNIVRGSFNPHSDGMRRLSSTPLLASGIFNARRIITAPDSFIWISIFLAERLERIYDKESKNLAVGERRLLAVSLRGSPLAAAVGLLTSTRFEIVDHLGPKHKILEEFTLRRMERDIHYVYVGDFIIGGTEIKIAEAYACATASTLDHALAIGTLLSPSDYGTRCDIQPLVNLKTVCPEAKYRFLEE